MQKNLIERLSAGQVQHKGLFPGRRLNQGVLMYREIFVEPKVREIEKLQVRDDLDLLNNKKVIERVRKEREEVARIRVVRNVEVNHSNMLNESGHEEKKAIRQRFVKVHKLQDDGGVKEECNEVQ